MKKTNYKELIKQTLNEAGLKISQVAGIGLDFKTIYITSNTFAGGKCIKTISGRNYKDVFTSVITYLSDL